MIKPSLLWFTLLAFATIGLSTEVQASVKRSCSEFGRPCDCPWQVHDCFPTCRIQPRLECTPTVRVGISSYLEQKFRQRRKQKLQVRVIHILTSPKFVLAGEERFQRGDLFNMMKVKLMYAVFFGAMWLGSAHAQSAEYPPIEEYLMPQANEIALAKSAAPANISERATIKVLQRSGYE